MSPSAPRRPPRAPEGRSGTAADLSTAWIVGLTLVPLLCIALAPMPVDASGRGTIDAVLAWLGRHGVPLSYEAVEATANILLFVPVGMVLDHLAHRLLRPPAAQSPWLVPVVALGLSAVIEGLQLVLLPQRFATLQDIALNAFGALVGLTLATRRRARHRPLAGR